MSHAFADIAFTPTVRQMQEEMGSRAGYAKWDDAGETRNERLSEREAGFIGERDSFYMASVSETGWPYIQHRGGPKGFVKTLNPTAIGFADFRGNRQYVTLGNLRHDNRVSLFFMDYRNRRRLKMLGRARVLEAGEDAILAKLEMPDYPAKVERGIVIEVAAFDWNCSQHIAERFTLGEIEAATQPLRQKIAELEAKLKGEDQASAATNFNRV